MLLKKMTLVQAHTRGKRTNRGAYSRQAHKPRRLGLLQSGACLTISCECSAGRWRYRPRQSGDGIAFVFGHRERQSRANGDCIDRAPALAAQAIILASNLHESRCRRWALTPRASNRCLRCSPSAVSNGRSRSTSRNSRICRAESKAVILLEQMLL